MRSVFHVAIKSARRLGMRAVMLIGDDFQFEWGDWNGCFTPTASEPGAVVSGTPPERRPRRVTSTLMCATSAGGLRTPR